MYWNIVENWLLWYLSFGLFLTQLRNLLRISQVLLDFFILFHDFWFLYFLIRIQVNNFIDQIYLGFVQFPFAPVGRILRERVEVVLHKVLPSFLLLLSFGQCLFFEFKFFLDGFPFVVGDDGFIGGKVVFHIGQIVDFLFVFLSHNKILINIISSSIYNTCDDWHLK